MMIDVFIADQFFHRWYIDEMKDFTIEGATWEEIIQAKEQLVEMYYQHFLIHTKPLLKNGTIYIVFESKMNGWPVEEEYEECEETLDHTAY